MLPLLHCLPSCFNYISSLAFSHLSITPHTCFVRRGLDLFSVTSLPIPNIVLPPQFYIPFSLLLSSQLPTHTRSGQPERWQHTPGHVEASRTGEHDPSTKAASTDNKEGARGAQEEDHTSAWTEDARSTQNENLITARHGSAYDGQKEVKWGDQTNC